eukprot:762019-Hanusia_phi.AAC.1
MASETPSARCFSTIDRCWATLLSSLSLERKEASRDFAATYLSCTSSQPWPMRRTQPSPHLRLIRDGPLLGDLPFSQGSLLLLSCEHRPLCLACLSFLCQLALRCRSQQQRTRKACACDRHSKADQPTRGNFRSQQRPSSA